MSEQALIAQEVRWWLAERDREQLPVAALRFLHMAPRIQRQRAGRCDICDQQSVLSLGAGDRGVRGMEVGLRRDAPESSAKLGPHTEAASEHAAVVAGRSPMPSLVWPWVGSMSGVGEMQCQSFDSLEGMPNTPNIM